MNAEFLTYDGRVCAYSGWDVQPLDADVKQPLVAGVVATFRTTVVFLKPDCFDRLPFQAIRVVVRVIADPTPRVNDGSVIMELMKQELSTDYTFAR